MVKNHVHGYNIKSIVLLLTSSSIVSVLYAIAYFISYTPPFLFAISIILVYFSAVPKHMFAPRNVLTAYYVIWYTIPVQFASRYATLTFREPEVVTSYLMLTASFLIGYNVLYFVENINLKTASEIYLNTNRLFLEKTYNFSIKSLFVFFLGMTIISAYLIIINSGGFMYWLKNPGQAFLNRGGAGVYSILLIFSSSLSAVLIGYYSYINNKIRPVLFFILFILLISPVLGGKARIFMTFAFAVLPWVFFAKTFSKKTVVIVISFLVAFVMGNWFRNHSWLTIDVFISYALNYFSTFEMLVISVRDFQPGWLKTVFLPFNKFKTPFGINDDSLFYDMSSWLTSIYFPNIWGVRATEQWPIETDLYLSFYYFLGIPFLIGYFVLIGLAFNLAHSTKKISYVFVSAYLTFQMLSHLRGGLILWTDFYMYPFYILSIFLLRNYYITNKRDTPI